MNFEGRLLGNRYEIIEKIGVGRYGYCIQSKVPCAKSLCSC